MRGGQSSACPAVRRTGHAPTHALLFLSLQTMMSSRIHPGASFPLGGGRRPDRPFNLRCQICRRQPEPGRKLVAAIAGGPGRTRDGGVRRDRTDDLMLAKHALYQLSYDPFSKRPAETGSTPATGGSHRPVCPPEGHTKCGGPRRTRTADLTLIRRVL